MKLVAWARAVKARASPGGPPPLWLFTDRARLGDPCAAAARLPRGLAGVVLRDDWHPARAALAARLARICRQRRLWLSIAGDWRLAAAQRAVLGAAVGVHLRGGRRLPAQPRGLPGLTASAHRKTELARARRAGALAFLSPAFATGSHPGERPLGPVRWASLAGPAGAAALGGIDGWTIRPLPPRRCRAAGAIAALR